MFNILSYLDQRVPSVVEMSSDDVTESLWRRPELAEDGAAQIADEYAPVVELRVALWEVELEI